MDAEVACGEVDPGLSEAEHVDRRLGGDRRRHGGWTAKAEVVVASSATAPINLCRNRTFTPKVLRPRL
jgi:hypothetical protein